jgi:hypothetical protein
LGHPPDGEPGKIPLELIEVQIGTDAGGGE